MKKQSKTGLIKAEPVTPTVVTGLDIPAEVLRIRDQVRANLEQFDADRRARGMTGASKADLWNQVCSVLDANTLVRENLNQIQVVLHTVIDAFYAKQNEREKQISEVLTKAEANDPLALQLWNKLRDDARREMIADVKAIESLANSSCKLANEYRQCILSKKYFFHISQIKAILALIMSVLHQNIHNSELLNKISEQIDEGTTKILPQGAEDEF